MFINYHHQQQTIPFSIFSFHFMNTFISKYWIVKWINFKFSMFYWRVFGEIKFELFHWEIGLPLWINEDGFFRAKTVDSASVSVASDALSEDGVSWFSPIAATEPPVPADDNCCGCCWCWCWCWCCWSIGLYGNVYWCDDDDGKYCRPFEFLLLLWTGLSSELLAEYVGYSRFLPKKKTTTDENWIKKKSDEYSISALLIAYINSFQRIVNTIIAHFSI